MGIDVYEKIHWDNIQHLIAFHCAPVLAGIKISNLVVTCEKSSGEVSKLLDGTEFEVFELSRLRGKVALLIFNREKLLRYLSEATCAEFLMNMGHSSTDVDCVLKELALRYSEYEKENASFPHELGIVLGYPVEDVKGFMTNDGQNYIFSGYWKVYCRAERARAIFRAYDDCVEGMMRALLSGKPFCEVVGL